MEYRLSWRPQAKVLDLSDDEFDRFSSITSGEVYRSHSSRIGSGVVFHQIVYDPRAGPQVRKFVPCRRTKEGDARVQPVPLNETGSAAVFRLIRQSSIPYRGFGLFYRTGDNHPYSTGQARQPLQPLARLTPDSLRNVKWNGVLQAVATS